MTPTRLDAYQLFHEGTLVFSKMESNGIRIDTDYLDRTFESIAKKITKLEHELRSDNIYDIWKRTYGTKTKLGAKEQLGEIIFGQMKHPRVAENNDEDAFEHLKEEIPFLASYFRMEKLKKAKGTYLEGIRRETIDGFLHPSFHLHTVRTMRSSSSDPNFHNWPIRDPEIGKLIRESVIPRDGCVIVEPDFGALEFRGAACFWKDPAMIKYASDKSLDIHRDTGGDCYDTPKDQVSKNMRYCGKNMMVFPLLYGSYYLQCAKNLWMAIDQMKLELKDGTPVKEHLKKRGITQLGRCDPKSRPLPGTFENHIRNVEKKFKDKFSTFRDGLDSWWKLYLSRGWFDLMTGFRIHGLYTRNELYNYPVQGSCFHCLLWSLIELQKEIEKRKWKTLLIGQIHDCILADVPHNELQDFLHLVKEITTRRLLKHWDWIVTPMEIEVDVVEEGSSWHHKKPWKEVNGSWVPVSSII